MPRIKTQLEAAGAEHLVLGHLLRMRVQSFITSQNFEDYDIVATNPEKNRSIKIQVKSRFKENDKSFPIKKLGSDFVVFVKLNCAKKTRTGVEYQYRKDPEYFVFPTILCEKKRKGKWNKVFLRDIDDVEQYRNNWKLVIDNLNE